jgi:hypothetical protein
MCAARAREFYDEQAKKRKEAGRPKKEPVANLPQDNSKARDAAGKAFGVSGRSVRYSLRRHLQEHHEGER